MAVNGPAEGQVCAVIAAGIGNEFGSQQGNNNKGSHFQKPEPLHELYKCLCHKAHGQNAYKNTCPNYINIVRQGNGHKHVVNGKGKVHQFYLNNGSPKEAHFVYHKPVKNISLLLWWGLAKVVIVRWRREKPVFKIMQSKVKQVSPAQGFKPQNFHEYRCKQQAQTP